MYASTWLGISQVFIVFGAKFQEGYILNGFGFGFRVPVSGFGDQVNLKCILNACVYATFL